MIILMGYLTVSAADVPAFSAATEAVAICTRAEPGCLFYGIRLDDAKSGRFLVAQRWRDEAALRAHMETPHAIAFLNIWKTRFAAELHQYDAANEQAL